MKIVRTRIVVSLASSAVLASGFGLTGFAVSSTAMGTAIQSVSQSAIPSCPNGTVYDYCNQP